MSHQYLCTRAYPQLVIVCAGGDSTILTTPTNFTGGDRVVRYLPNEYVLSNLLVTLRCY